MDNKENIEEIKEKYTKLSRMRIKLIRKLELLIIKSKQKRQ